MLTAIISIIILACIILVLLVLAQDSKGGGLVSQAGATQLMGVKKTADIIEKLTWGFAIGIMVLVISTTFITGESVEDGEDALPTTVGIEAAKTAKDVKPNPTVDAANSGAAQPAQQGQAPAADSAAK